MGFAQQLSASGAEPWGTPPEGPRPSAVRQSASGAGL